MKKACLFYLAIGLFLAVPGLSQAATAAAGGAAMLTVTPGEIRMGAGYDGTTVKIEGRVPAGSDVILRFVGAAGELHMRQKGKVFGLLWMNRSALTFKNVPRVFLVQASKPFDQLGPAAGSYGLDSLRKVMKIEEAAAGDGDLDARAELLRLKKREGLCRESSGGITFGPEAEGMRSFAAELHLPAALSPGRYAVEAVAVKDGQVVGQQTLPVTASLVGLPAWLSNMAFKHGVLYGILAVITAILGGLLIGLVFQGKGGGAH